MEDKIVVIKFPLYTFSTKELQAIYDDVSRVSSEPVILMPQEYEFVRLSEGELKQIRQMIDLILGDKDDSNSKAVAGS